MAEEEKNEIEEPEATAVEAAEESAEGGEAAPVEAEAEGEETTPAPPETEPEAAAAEPAPIAEEPAAPPKKAAPKKPKAEAKPKPATKPKARAPRKAGERKPIVRLPKPERERGKQKERRGVVVSSAMDKTIVVRVDTVRPHPAYKKVVTRSQKFHAHDEQNAANVGDVVMIVETRPVSKTKSWRLAEVLQVAK